MANKLYEESNVQAIANAIRTKKGEASTVKYKIADMAQGVLDIPSGGGKTIIQDNQGCNYLFANGRPIQLLDNIQFKNITSLLNLCYNNSTFSTQQQDIIDQIAEESQAQITSINYAFNSNSNLTTIDLSDLTFKPSGVTCEGVFKSCSKLTSITGFPTVLGSAKEAFFNCNVLSSISIPGETINPTSTEAMFYSCKALTNLSIPEIISTTYNQLTSTRQMFGYCQSLENLDITIDLKSISNTSYSEAMFQSCSALKTLKFNISSTVNRALSMSNMFNGCSSLETLHFGGNLVPPSKITFSTNTFTGCSSLKNVVLNHKTSGDTTTFFALSSSSILSPIPADCKFYVPDAVVNDYKTATNWSARAAYIFPISEYVES